MQRDPTHEQSPTLLAGSDRQKVAGDALWGPQGKLKRGEFKYKQGEVFRYL
jgi:hypothetical protein